MPESVTALDFLLGGGIDPERVAASLPHVDAASVVVRVAGSSFRRVWGERIAAVTMPWAIYVRPWVMERHLAGGQEPGLAVLMVHELAHVEQLARLGVPRQVTTYGLDYVRGRLRRLGHWEAYRGVRFEIEARLIASEFVAGSSA